MKAKVHLFRTYYSHWGKYSGINRFIEYANSDKYQINAKVVAMGWSDFPIPSIRIRSLATEWIKKNGVTAYDLNDLMAEIFAFGKWLQGRVDLLHYLDGEHSLQYLPSLIRRLSFKNRTTPIVATFHQPPAKLATLINPNIIRLLDHVTVLCPEQKTYFEQYLPKAKISLIPHGIDTDHFQPASPAAEQQNKFKCLTVGSWLRDYDTVLAVAKRLEAYSDIEFHIVSSQVGTAYECKNVFVYQGIDDAALLRLYQYSDVLFLPLLGATANNALLEGIACGLPVVSTKLPAIETYVPGEEAILSDENNPEVFAKTLLYLYEHPEMRSRMSLYARQRAMELSWTKITRQFETLYSQLLTQTSKQI